MSNSRDSKRKDSPFAVAKRLVGFARQSEALRDFRFGALPTVSALVMRRGLDVRTVHAVHAQSHPERIAAIDAHGETTYRDLNDAINQCGHLFEDLGVEKGSPVVLCMENRTEYLIAWFALFRLGVPAVHASYRSTAREMEYVLTHSGARIVVVSERTRDAAHAAIETLAGDFSVLDADPCTQGLHLAEALRDQPTRFVDPAPGTPSSTNVVYTSGTTGQPKGAKRNFARFGILELSRVLSQMPVKFGDRHLVVSPLYHSAAQAFSLIFTSLAGTLYLEDHFDPALCLEKLDSHRIHSTFMVPAMIRRLLNQPEPLLREHHPGAFKLVISGAAPFDHPTRMRAIDYFGEEAVFDFYGATELGWVTLISGREMQSRPGSVGRPLAGHEIQIRDEDRALGPGEVGRIFVKSAQSMEGYIGGPEETEDSWLTVDDLGYLDEDGYLYLSGRDRDMVISGGVNLYPVEIEDVLQAHPEIEEIGVFGLPDDEWGEVLVAAYVGDATPEELDAWAREELSSHKVPKRWFEVPSLPRNETGKIQKRRLIERFSP